MSVSVRGYVGRRGQRGFRTAEPRSLLWPGRLRERTVGVSSAHWLEERIADGAVGPRVGANYRSILRNHIVPTIGPIRLKDLRTDQVLALKTRLLDAGRAPATTKKIIGLVKQGLNAAVAASLLPRNPASSVPSPPVAGRSRERRALSEEEIGKLLREAEGTQYAVGIRLALATGARQAELLGATWEAVSPEDRTFLVERTLGHVEGEFRMLPPKTRNGRRTVELSEATVTLLKRHRASQNAERLRLGPIWQDHDLVPPRPDGRPQYRQSFYRGFRRSVEASGLASPESVNFHGSDACRATILDPL